MSLCLVTHLLYLVLKAIFNGFHIDRRIVMNEEWMSVCSGLSVGSGAEGPAQQARPSSLPPPHTAAGESDEDGARWARGHAWPPAGAAQHTATLAAERGRSRSSHAKTGRRAEVRRHLSACSYNLPYLPWVTTYHIHSSHRKDFKALFIWNRPIYLTALIISFFTLAHIAYSCATRCYFNIYVKWLNNAKAILKACFSFSKDRSSSPILFDVNSDVFAIASCFHFLLSG